MLTPISAKDQEEFIFLQDLFPILSDASKVQLDIKEGQPILLAPDWGWSGEWMQGLRDKLGLPELRLWVVPIFVDPDTILTPGLYDLRLAELPDATPALYAQDDAAPILLTGALKLYYEGWEDTDPVQADKDIQDWEVFLRFPTHHWYQWIGQDHEIELRRKDGKYYLLNTCAGFCWRAYPFLRHFEKQIGHWRLDYTIQIEVLDALDPTQDWPDFVGYLVATPDGEPIMRSYQIKDAAIATGADAHLYLFSEDPTVPLEAQIRVAGKAEIMVVDHGDAEYEDE